MKVEHLNDLRISFNYRHGIIRVSKKVILALGNPKYVFFTWSEDTSTMTIYGTEELNGDCLLVSRHMASKGTGGLRFNGQAFIRRIGSFVNWDLDKRYTVCGALSPNSRSVNFDLSKAASL